MKWDKYKKNFNYGRDNTMNATISAPAASKSKTANIDDAVCEQVLERLGHPSNLLKIEAGNVGGNNYRVNVWCKSPPAEMIKNAAGMIIQEPCFISSYMISDSFYVRVSPEGGIIYSNPPINKRY
tara:strand:- start:480 stop:854 length:375 start_codon:yes stop_codon:yes gene_type:complete